MIIKDKIPMFMVGYPTMSDKYNVAGGVLEGSNPVKFGDLVKFGSSANYYEKAGAITSVSELAGFVVATNVKLADYFTNEVNTLPGEAFNLLVGGFIAIELDADAVEADIVPNSIVKVLTTTSKVTTSSVTTNAAQLPNCVFTGKYEKHGTKLVAEIYVK